MEAMTLRELVEAVNGAILGAPNSELLIAGVSTDSRTIKKGDLFIPLSGEHYDGHDYIGDALVGGASACLTGVVPESMLEDKAYIKVENPLTALGALAAYYLKKCAVPVVAVTGSVGKTTTKDMLASVLGERYRVLKTEGNYNNDVGLPLTILRLSAEDEIAVLEMGMNHAGEIDGLAAMANPDVAVITNIGDAHIENLGSREQILAAKAEILNHLKPGATVLLGGDDELLLTLKNRTEKTLLCGEGEGCDVRCIASGPSGEHHIHCTAQTAARTYELDIPAIGQYMIYPTLFAVAAGEHFGLSAEEIKAGVSKFAPTKMRMNIVRRGDNITILDDTYNANPQSMRAAVEALSTMPSDYKIAILGDMFELGAMGPALHRSVGEYAARKGLNCLVAIGENARHIYDAAVETGMSSVLYYETVEDVNGELERLLRPGCTVLVKASRGMQLERIVEKLIAVTGEP